MEKVGQDFLACTLVDVYLYYLMVYNSILELLDLKKRYFACIKVACKYTCILQICAWCAVPLMYL